MVPVCLPRLAVFVFGSDGVIVTDAGIVGSDASFVECWLNPVHVVRDATTGCQRARGYAPGIDQWWCGWTGAPPIVLDNKDWFDL